MSTAFDVVSQMSFRSIGGLTYPGPDAMDATVVSSKQTVYVDLPREFFQMITAVGPYLYRDTVLLQKVSLLNFICYVLYIYEFFAKDLFFYKFDIW